MSKLVPGEESIERVVDFERLGAFALIYRDEREYVDEVEAVHREYQKYRAFFAEEFGVDHNDPGHEEGVAGRARKAWEDAFDVAVHLGNQDRIINYYSDKNNEFTHQLTRRFLKDGTIQLDEYDINYLVALEVAFEVLGGGVEEVERLRDRFRDGRMTVAADGVPGGC
jgi:hypothetical protein